MGQEIVYCSKCQTQLRGADFEKGKAFRIERQAYCSACVSSDPSLLPSKPLLPDPVPANRDEAHSAPKPGSTSRVPHLGHEIVYCSRCQNQLRGADFEKGKAFRIERQIYCFACVSSDPSLLPSKPLLPDSDPANRDEVKPGSTSRVPHLAPAPRAFHPENQGRPLMIGLGAAGLVVGLIAIAAVAAGRSASARGTPRAAAAPSPDPEPAPPVRKEDRREADVRETPKRIDPETARRREIEALVSERATLDEEVRADCAKGEFQHALGVLEKAGPRHLEDEWTAWIQKRTTDVQNQAEILYGPLKEKALSGRRRGAADEVRVATEQVARLGIQRLRDDLDRALEAVAPAVPAVPPPVRPEADALKVRWEAAAALAGSRDYAGAIAEIERGLASIRDPGVRGEATADVEALRQASALLNEALQALSKWPRGQKVALGVYDEAGAPKRVEGAVVKADAQRLEVRADAETAVVEFGEALPGSLAEALRERVARKPGTDGRAAVVWCLLEGDLEGARRHQGAPPVEVPEKYWAHARRMAEARAAADPREREARELFYSADRDAGGFKTAAAGIQKCETLLKDFKETAFVRRNRSSIDARAEAGREFLFFSGDMTGGGAFRLSRNSKGESAWTTEPDSEAVRGADAWLSDLAWTSATSGWGPVEKDMSNGNQAAGDGKIITLNGVTYPKGLGMHAPAEVKYALGGKYASFVADVGLDDAAGNGSVVFQVWADGTMLFDSGVMRQETATKAVNVSLAGRQELRLVVTDGGDGITNDEADWGGARLIGGTPSLKSTFLDLEFSALPDREYRGWLFVGGCCAEGLTFHLQATELTGSNPRTKEPAPAEPGGDVFLPVKHGLSVATRTHAGHASRKEKEPARWGWVQIPLPRYSTPGPKKVRFLTEQKGLWVAYACVSAVKGAPPVVSEMKEIEKARPETPARLPGEKGPGLVIANTLPKSCVWDVADVGKAQYADRNFTFTSGPASFVGLRYLRTASEDKSSKGNSFISFEVNQLVTVYVVHDDRIAAKPAWLAAFTATGEKVVTGAGTFRVFAKDFPAGRVTLGGNTADGAGSGLSMYTVAVRPKGAR